MTVKIDGEYALELLREVVEEAGADYVDPSSEGGRGMCRYVARGEPACIAGRALFKAGVPVDILAEWDTRDTSGIDEVLLPDEVELTPAARTVLGRAQDLQDNGSTWGDALANAQRGLALARLAT